MTDDPALDSRPLPLAVGAFLTFIVGSGCAAQTTVRGWGDRYFDTAVTEVAPAQVSAAFRTTIVRRLDGRVFMRGNDGPGCVVPTLPLGVTYTDVAAGRVCVGLRSDGLLEQWGPLVLDPQYAPLMILPSVPSGLSCIGLAAGQIFAMALLSNGSILAWGRNDWGSCNVPALGPGLAYTSVSCGGGHGLAIVSPRCQDCCRLS